MLGYAFMKTNGSGVVDSMHELKMRNHNNITHWNIFVKQKLQFSSTLHADEPKNPQFLFKNTQLFAKIPQFYLVNPQFLPKIHNYNFFPKIHNFYQKCTIFYLKCTIST